MIEVKACFRNGEIVSHAAHDDLPRGTVPGTPGLVPMLHRIVEDHHPADNSFVWVALFAPTKAELAAVAGLFDLPHFEVEDAANPRQRAKVELGEGRAFLVFKLLEYVESTSDIETGQMSVFIGDGYVVTIRFGSTGNMNWVLDRLGHGEELTEHGPVAVLHAVLDEAVDEYLRVVDEVSLDIEQIEVSVFSPGRTDDSSSIYKLKRENLEIRRAIAPLVPAATLLARDQQTQLPKHLQPYFRDIADHLLRAGDIIDANDSLLLTMLMASTARLDLQQNADMRRISAWVAMAAVPTMIAGIYGMNFDDMPELRAVWGYPAVLIFMATCCGLMYRQFKKSGWL